MQQLNTNNNENQECNYSNNYYGDQVCISNIKENSDSESTENDT